ncbi:MAG: PadR family transcriptional regulator [Candidatus Cloacimonetes bacterium]|nr:PadR family transcriptional regulator [Candidatus Cloacimonadota bacterium]
MSKSDMVVLGFLHIKPMYGYEIIQFVQERQLDVWAGIKMPSVYNALHRLEMKKCITGRQITEGNNPPRTVYHLTDDGITYFRRILRLFLKKKNILSQDFWLTISFIHKSIDRETLLNTIDQRITEVEKHLCTHDINLDNHDPINTQIDIPFYVKILVEVGGKIHRVELEGLRKLRQEILKKENQFAFINKEDN